MPFSCRSSIDVGCATSGLFGTALCVNQIGKLISKEFQVSGGKRGKPFH
jgi:hypothetical protein